LKVMQETRTAEDAEVISLRLGGLISVSQVTPKLSTPLHPSLIKTGLQCRPWCPSRDSTRQRYPFSGGDVAM